MNRRSFLAGAIALGAMSGLNIQSSFAQTKLPSGHKRKKFKFGYSIYVTWEIFEYLRVSGLMDRWSAAYGIEVELVPFNLDYMRSVSAMASGDLQGVTVTNMDTFTGPAMSQDVTMYVVMDYSNGNDGIALRDGLKLADLRGKELVMMDDSVSEYLTYRALGADFEKLAGIRNMSDSKIASTFATDEGATKAAVTWEPVLTGLRGLTGKSAVAVVFDSKQIPEEILDGLVIPTKIAQENPDFVAALTGAYYEALAIVRRGAEQPGVDKAADQAINLIARHCDVSPDQYRSMLTKTTAVYWTPAEGVEFVTSARFKERAATVRNTCLALAKLNGKNGLGIQVDARELAQTRIVFPDGTGIGGKAVGLRFDATFMQAAAAGLIKRS